MNFHDPGTDFLADLKGSMKSAAAVALRLFQAPDQPVHPSTMMFVLLAEVQAPGQMHASSLPIRSSSARLQLCTASRVNEVIPRRDTVTSPRITTESRRDLRSVFSRSALCAEESDLGIADLLGVRIGPPIGLGQLGAGEKQFGKRGP